MGHLLGVDPGTLANSGTRASGQQILAEHVLCATDSLAELVLLQKVLKLPGNAEHFDFPLAGNVGSRVRLVFCSSFPAPGAALRSPWPTPGVTEVFPNSGCLFAGHQTYAGGSFVQEPQLM